MDVFYNLINQIVSLPEDSTEEFLNNYDLFLETMLSNTLKCLFDCMP